MKVLIASLNLDTARKIRLSGIKGGVLIMLTIGVISCGSATPTPDDQSIDHSFMTEQPCAAPCWYGLYINKSTEAEAIAGLQQIKFIDFSSKIERKSVWAANSSAKKLYFDCLYDSGRYPGCVALVISDDLVKEIQLSVLYDLPMKTTVEKLGSPNYFAVTIQPGEDTACSITIGWTQKLIFSNSYQKKPCPKQNKIPPDTKVTTLYYSATDDLDPQNCTACVPFPGFDEP